ncbi:hypothetical protein CC86DRAFT_286712, partial [Ophiobolus disseminans]
LDERRLSIVRTAAIIQDALGQKLEDEIVNVKAPLEKQEWPVFTTIGFVAGRIVQIGPDYVSLVSSSSAAQDWMSCWGDHYQTEADIEILRWIYEEYAAKILDYENTDLSRIRDIYDPYVSARPLSRMENDCKVPGPSQATKIPSLQTTEGAVSEGAHICLGTGHVMGLVSPAATVGDVIVKFWNCDAAIVMRPVEPHSEAISFMLVGRADVAEIINGRSSAFSKSRLVHESNAGSKHSEAVQVDLNMRTLQKITAYVTTKS